MEHHQKPKSVERIFSKELENNEIKNEMNENKKFEKKIDRNDSKYETDKYTFNFQQFVFGTVSGNISEANKNQSNLLENTLEFNGKTRPTAKEDKKKNNTFESINSLYDGWELTPNAFKSRIFPLKPMQEKGINILTRKQVPQRLLISLAHMEPGNVS